MPCPLCNGHEPPQLPTDWQSIASVSDRKREALWALRKDRHTYECDLLSGPYGIEARIFRDGARLISRRFETLAQAERWAVDERQAIENGESWPAV